MIEKDFDIPFIADLALREKQIQQNYRPVIAVHKWFARRPGTLFRGLILSEFVAKPCPAEMVASIHISGTVHSIMETVPSASRSSHVSGGQGFGVRREDMKKMLIATRGKVFTADTLSKMVEHTRLKDFASKPA